MADTDVNIGIAIFAGGCFWGVEYYFEKAEGVLETQVGYIGGDIENPTYQQVCAGGTHHVEAIQVKYDFKKTSYETLARLFFEIHDPTQLNHQGPDHGEQYRSVVFYQDEVQRNIAEALIEELELIGYEVVTTVEPVAVFWPAENHHQHYYNKKHGEPYCHARIKRFTGG